MSVMVETTKEDANNLDEVVHELGIEDSFTTPAEAVRKLKAEIVRLQSALLHNPMDQAVTKDNEILQKAWEKLTILTLRAGFGVSWMHVFIAQEFDKLCADPVMRAKIGVD